MSAAQKMDRSKVALIMGGGRRGGIGHGCSLALARDGVHVVVADLNPAHARETAEDIVAAGGQAIACTADVRVEADVAAAVKQASDVFGGLDILVNNVGLSHPDDRDLREITTDLWDEVMEVNVRGVMLGCKHAVPEMLRHGRGGAIVNISSTNSLYGQTWLPAYATSKAAINGLTRSVATQFGKLGIRCNAVAPGMIATPDSQKAGEAYAQMMIDNLLTDRIGRPADIADMVAFLASDSAHWITGQIFVVDGGLTAHAPHYSDLRRTTQS
jgi:NAD(P)-dependent dehydrogenase (short-subunit alcohol dehydrogenase family)